MWGPNAQNLAKPYKSKNGEIMQFFTAVKDGVNVLTFVVNHNDFPSATSYISEARKQGIWDTEFDYVRSSTVQEVGLFVSAFKESHSENTAA